MVNASLLPPRTPLLPRLTRDRPFLCPNALFPLFLLRQTYPYRPQCGRHLVLPILGCLCPVTIRASEGRSETAVVEGEEYQERKATCYGWGVGANEG